MDKKGWIDEINGWELTETYPKINTELIDKIKLDDTVLGLEYDAIIVLAGGITDEGLVHPWVERRLYASYLLYKNRRSKIICLGGGSYHIPVICNTDGFIIHESTSCAEYLINLGIDNKDVYKEWSSYDTIANGYFGFTNHIIPMEIKKIVLITSEFHMDRSKAIFNWINELYNNIVDIHYYSVKDDGLDTEIIKNRLLREKESLFNLKQYVIPKINTVKKLHKWFYEDHKAYCSNSHRLRSVVLSEDIKKSY